ncbi:uncharacterized protein LOC110919317 [Helianthus annuus]|uniref:uncharacterized protein LOC110919317 n=1 Tax=Helianthus annuus TaxID=4232 RepID=UPI001652E404|nr:uncharacterized protein LOC110919317 [Helianthus annuus]
MDENGDFKAFIAKIVKEPDMFTEWMKSIGETVKNVEEKSVSSDESSQSADESLQSSDDSSEKEVVFDQTPSDSSSSDDNSEKSIEFDHTKSEDWFLNALNGTTSGFSDTSSVNCLLGLDEDFSVPEKKDVLHKGVIGKNPKGNTSAQDIHSVPDLERTSSFGSASSSPSLASLPPIRVHVDDSQKVGGIEEQFAQMSVQQQHQKVQEVGDYVAVPAPVVVVSGVPASNARAAAEYLNQQQKQSAGFDLASTDSVSSDGRQKPVMIYQDQLLNIQSSNNNRASDLSNNVSDQNVRIQMQQQQIPDSAYVMSMSNPQENTPYTFSGTTEAAH